MATLGAALTTHQGKVIPLDEETCQAVLELLQNRRVTIPKQAATKPEPVTARDETRTLIEKLQRKYSRYPSFNQALLEQRAEDRAREA
ncbi:MAG: hypothetical protein CVU38_08205 [Chloroflexi bacterium HGW-Chloroflexi-1]|nr:MAG: hypothetical protein CVU38_08205 [Chloroflexi bacterium HGW-Chloroflexi-1]